MACGAPRVRSSCVRIVRGAPCVHSLRCAVGCVLAGDQAAAQIAVASVQTDAAVALPRGLRREPYGSLFEKFSGRVASGWAVAARAAPSFVGWELRPAARGACADRGTARGCGGARRTPPQQRQQAARLAPGLVAAAARARDLADGRGRLPCGGRRPCRRACKLWPRR
eukprot:236794-Chlamydomonas_euryale.AAC.7